LSSKYSDLSKDRIWGEWEKWAEKGMYPSHGLNFLVTSDWVKHYPQIKNIIGVPQNPVHHPEGCVWTHTKLVCDAMSDICNRENIIGQERVVFMLAALCHDLGKAFPKDGGTTEYNVKGWTSAKHAEAGISLTEKLLINLSCPNKIKDGVLPLVAEHMFVATNKEISDKHICNLAFRLKKSSIKKLLLLIEADMSGRSPKPKGLDEKCILFKDRAVALGVYEKPLKPLITGDDLLALGYTQGEELGKMFKKLYQHQMNHPEYTKEKLLKDRNGL
jgi:tRNA nucleotidyltransferase (CCA-adding enzyme)